MNKVFFLLIEVWLIFFDVVCLVVFEEIMVKKLENDYKVCFDSVNVLFGVYKWVVNEKGSVVKVVKDIVL